MLVSTKSFGLARVVKFMAKYPLDGSWRKAISSFVMVQGFVDLSCVTSSIALFVDGYTIEAKLGLTVETTHLPSRHSLTGDLLVVFGSVGGAVFMVRVPMVAVLTSYGLWSLGKDGEIRNPNKAWLLVTAIQLFRSGADCLVS